MEREEYSIILNYLPGQLGSFCPKKFYFLKNSLWGDFIIDSGYSMRHIQPGDFCHAQYLNFLEQDERQL